MAGIWEHEERRVFSTFLDCSQMSGVFYHSVIHGLGFSFTRKTKHTMFYTLIKHGFWPIRARAGSYLYYNFWWKTIETVLLAISLGFGVDCSCRFGVVYVSVVVFFPDFLLCCCCVLFQVWRRRLVLRHKLTMHTAFAREDNSAPAAITSLLVSK